MPKVEDGPDSRSTDFASGNQPPGETRRQLLINVIVFQFKLFLDSARDLILSPLSIFALVIGILFGGNQPMQFFNGLLLFGRRTEAWINLFGRYDATADSAFNHRTPNAGSMDADRKAPTTASDSDRAP